MDKKMSNKMDKWITEMKNDADNEEDLLAKYMEAAEIRIKEKTAAETG